MCDCYVRCIQAHKALTDLETSRDGLLYEQHKLESQNKTDIKQLQQFFAEAEGLSVSWFFNLSNQHLRPHANHKLKNSIRA